jgi:hypothetical protein
MNNHLFIAPDVTAPTGTTSSDEWHAAGPTHPDYRFITGPCSAVDDVEVLALAVQLGDGTVDDGSRVGAPSVRISLGAGDYGMSASLARELADRLVTAAAWVDVLRKPSGTPDTFTTSQSDD